jgi:hypothetical protein
MLELTSYGLTGLAAMVDLAFCSAYGDEFRPTSLKSSFDLIDNARLNDCPISVAKGPDSVQRNSLQTDCGPAEAFHV